MPSDASEPAASGVNATGPAATEAILRTQPGLVTLGEGLAMGCVGAAIGLLAPFAPRGNGLSGTLLCIGCVCGMLLTLAATRRFTNLPASGIRAVATVVALIVGGLLSFCSAHPPRSSALTYMIGGPLPATVDCDLVRRQWFDGPIYIATFRADVAAFDAILANRSYVQTEPLNAKKFKSHWRGDFEPAQIVDATWREPPDVTSPRLFLWAMPPRGPGTQSEFAALLIDDANGRCWMLYALGLLGTPESNS